MNKIIENYVDEIEYEMEDNTLSIFCVDTVTIKDKMTFDSCTVDGVQVTYWQDDDEDIEKRIDSIFEMLFEEVIKTRNLCRNKVEN